ncbi:MAG: glycoside hydrolase [Bacteroidales bacterium]|nr:glycoside hydrolase [Bacteroidales bacterium]
MKQFKIVLTFLMYLSFTGSAFSQKVINSEKTINVNTSGKPLGHYWSKCVGAGRANEGLRASWLEHLALVQRECGFKYSRFHGLFHDDMFVMRKVNGKTNYNWQYIDDLFDRMLAINVRPFVELGFFPYDISSEKTVFWWGGHGTPPADFEEWENLVAAFVNHCIVRYGKEEVLQWYFEVWNEPNLPGFWNGTKEEYFKMYKITAEAIKAIDPALKVGGPATSSYHPDEGVYERLSKQKEIKPEDFENIQCKGPWIEDFLKYCEKEKLPVDFISSHPYPTTYPFDEQKNYFEMSRPINCVYKDISWLKQVVEKSNYNNATIELTEWSSSPSSRDYTHDYLQAATYVVKINLDCIGMANSLSYWTFTDVFEEAGAGNSMFHGGFGMINYQGIVKPVFHAYRFLNMLGDEEINREGNKIVTRDSKTGFITALTYNYPDEIKTAVPISKENREAAEKILHTGSAKKISIRLSGLKPGSTFEVEIVDENNGFALTKWKEMGMPDHASREQTKELKEYAMATKKYTLKSDNNGYLVWDIELLPWAVAVLKQIK